MLPSVVVSMAVSGIKDSLKQQGVRLTRQRKILLDLIDQSGQHLDAAGHPEGRQSHHDGDQHYYETRLKQEHAHVICLRCGKIEEFFGDLLQQMREQIESHFGFKIVLARTEVGGYCSHCQVLRAKEMEALSAESRRSHA